MLFLLLRRLGDAGLGGDEETGDGGRILQRRAHNLGGVEPRIVAARIVFRSELIRSI